MKNKFLSKSVPRGTRTIWRYLGALFLLFTFAIGQMWGQTTWVKLDSIDFTNTTDFPAQTITGANSAVTTATINGVFFRAKAKKSIKINNTTAGVDFDGQNGDASSHHFGIPVTGVNGSIKVIIYHDYNNTSANFKMGISHATDNDPSGTQTWDFGVGNSGATKNANDWVMTKSGLTGSEYIVWAVEAGSSYKVIKKIAIYTEAPSCDATAPGNISKGALSAGILTLQVADDPKTGDEFYWQTSATGTTKNKTGENINFGKTYQVSAADTYYIRSYNVAGDCWSDAKSFEVKATDLVANYTVIYKDGTTELGSETVEVGHHPTATAITTTKDLYTFAAWQESGVDKALEDVSAADGETVTLTARYTAQYTSGTYEFTGHLTMGTAPNQMVIENNSDGKDYSAGRIDNIYVSAQKIGYEATGNYGGWKLKTTNGTLRFLVENACGVRVTLGEANPLRIAYTEGGVAKTEDIAKSTTSSVYKADANTLVTLTNITSGNKTVTLKKIEILPLYNATYTDGKGDASGSASNVTEVTLPTPSATTVDGYSFIGWIANQTVYKGETAKTAGEGLDAGETYTLTANTAFTAQWQLISDFDVKFFQGYGDPDAQIGTTQSISTGNYATAPEDPVRAGFVFLGWSYDGTEAHIVDVAAYGITAATNFRAMWKAVWTVTFDGAGAVNVENDETVASPDSPTQAGKIFQGWYNGESKYDFSSAVTGNLALTSKWADADPNHYVYAYNDDFHFDGVVYKTPEGAVDGGSGTSNIAMTTPYTLFEGAEGITSIVMTDGIYDSKTGAIQAVTALMKVNNNATSKLTVTIKSGYTATLKIKSSGYSAARTINVSDATPASGTTTGQAVTSGAMSVSGIGELSFALNSGSHDLTVTGGTLYIAELDIEATALPTHTVTYKAGEGTGDDVEDADATNVADVPSTFTAPTGKVFNGWKDETNADVEVGTIVSSDMTLTAQWIAVYAVTFNMNGHGEAIDPQDIKEGAKATRPDDPIAIGFDFGGWFTDEECTAGNEFDFNTSITAATPLYAKWTEFEGCALLYPALSGDALHVGDNVTVQTGSKGGSIAVVGMKEDGSISYNANGLFLSSGGADVISVTLNNDIAVGTKISVTLMAANTGSRGLNLLNATGGKVKGGTKLGWDDATLGEVGTFSYTVEASDGLEGTNIFRLQRNNSVYLQCVKVEACGAAITYHSLTSEVNIAGKGTVTFGASSVREGYTTTATYSEIDPLYEFVNWTVSGAGASVENATANPATITVGTEDAVVTLNLQLIPVKFTVEYYDGATLMGSEQVAVNENPTASEIVTAKRHYTFLGWSETDGGDVVALNTITRTEAGTVMLYAKYEAVACPTSGTIFSMEFDETKKPGETVTIAKDASIDLAEYATISGGNAMIINGETSGKDAISTDGEFLLKATKEVMKIELNCVLQEGDIIRIPDNSAKLVISTSNAKTGTYQAFADKNTHEFAVTAAWVGVDDIYVLYDGSSLKFTKVYVIRPAKFDVSFNMMGHGTQIADIEDVIEGSKISAPTAPTDADYSFAGWYKENTLANEWKFDVDVVEANTTLYAKWLDKSDATLKSLKYGAEEITLEAGVFEYNVSLPAFTSAVPTLTAETSNPNATKVISNAAAFDSEGNATSTVTVTPEVGADQVYTVNFAKGVLIPLQEVTGSITWNFANAVTANVSITGTPQVLANYAGVTNDNTFESDKLEASGEKFSAGTKANLRANYIHFHTTVPGKLSISYSNTGGSNPARYIYVNGVKYDEDGSANTTPKGADNKVFVPAGDVELVMKDGEDASKNVQIYQMIFNATPDYTRPVTEGRYGTICLPNGGVMVGAELFEIAYYGQTSHKIFLDNIPSGEMVAGRPYIFLPKEGTTQLAVFYTDETNASAGSHNGLIGFIGDAADAYFYIPAGEGNYILQNNLYREVLTGGQARILSNRAYIKLSAINLTEPALAPGRRRVAMGVQSEQVATGCENLNVSDKPVKMIINGQLFILRGEKMYDAKGQLVK